MKKLGAALLLGMTLCAGAQPAPPASNTAAAASRDLWLGDEGRYVRRWLLLGPMSTDQADSLAKSGVPTALTDPAPADRLSLAGNGALAWRALGTYGDVLDGFGGAKDGEAGFALATVERDAAADAVLLLGGNVRGVWVNGQWSGGAENSPAFTIDGLEVKTKLLAGPNRILLRVERFDRPVLLTLRVVAPGFVDATPGTIAPYAVDGPGNNLVVAPGTRPGALAAVTSYEVIAPGGRVMANVDAPRDGAAKFDTTSWPDGPYEIRVSGMNELYGTALVFLPWFKGDAQAAAQRLVEAAAQPGAGEQVKMLADMVRDRRGGEWRDLHSPLMEYAELLLEHAGQTGGARAYGFIRLGWTDNIDGSTQYCRAYLPGDFDAGKPSPAMLFLHGYNPPNPPYVRWWSIADRHNGVADRHQLVVLEPMGRGNVDYRWMGERDVLRCLTEAKRRFAIDANRVYLSGESMGGNGTWLIASRNPQVFAAAAPVFGGWDYRINLNGYNYTNPEGTRPMERFVHEAHASFAGAEGLLNVPMFVLQGDSDTAVPVEQSRHGVRLLQRWGYDVRYREIPGRGHEDLKARDEIADWLLKQRRVSKPREVRLRSYDLAGAAANWVRVTASDNPFEMIEARARFVADLTVRLDTKNAERVVLTPPDLYASNSVHRTDWRVIWNGVRHDAVMKDGALSLTAAGAAPRAGDKSPALEGRLTYFFGTPFAIVIGTTSKDPAMNAGLAAKADALADLWERWQHVQPRSFRDTEVTPDIQKKYSLLLLGGASANQVAARIAPQLPMKVSRDAVTIDGRRFDATDAVAQMLYRHPDNADRYVLLVEPQSVAGLRYWNPQQYWHALNGFPMNFWDWTIVDGRHALQSSGLLPDRGWVAAGVFDNHWRRSDTFTVTGDPELRARAPLRQPPAAGFKLPAGALVALAGRYQINPGQIGGGGSITVARAGDTITATAPEGGRAFTLEAEDGNNFAVVGLGTPVSFLRDGAGFVTGLTYNYNGQEIVATRINGS